MVSNENLVKYHDCIDSEVLMYDLVKYYSFGGSFNYMYNHKLVRPYEGLFQHKLIYSSIITPYHIYKHIIIVARPLEFYSCIMHNGRI